MRVFLFLIKVKIKLDFARYRFAPKTLAGWSVLIGTVATLGLVVITMISCPRLEVTSTNELACSR